MAQIPPEKYYEACITYHLVQYFETHYGKKLYPFSITQVREKDHGFDFGYHTGDGRLFLGQYKRPSRNSQGRYAWQINQAQLETLSALRLPTFYILPAFHCVRSWYEGLEQTYFLPVRLVHAWVAAQGRKQATLQETPRLCSIGSQAWYDPFGGPYEQRLPAGAQTEEASWLDRLAEQPEEALEGLWGYWIEGG